MSKGLSQKDAAAMVEQIKKLRAKLEEENGRIIRLILERDRFKLEAEKRWALRKEIEELLEVGDSYDDSVKEEAIEKIKSLRKERAEAKEELAAARVEGMKQMQGLIRDAVDKYFETLPLEHKLSRFWGGAMGISNYILNEAYKSINGPSGKDEL